MTALLSFVDCVDVLESRAALDTSFDPIDLEAAVQWVSDLLVALGQDPTSLDLAQTLPTTLAPRAADVSRLATATSRGCG